METFKVMIISTEFKNEDDQVDELQRLGHLIMRHTDVSIQTLEERLDQKFKRNDDHLETISESVN